MCVCVAVLSVPGNCTEPLWQSEQEEASASNSDSSSDDTTTSATATAPPTSKNSASAASGSVEGSSNGDYEAGSTGTTPTISTQSRPSGIYSTRATRSTTSATSATFSTTSSARAAERTESSHSATDSRSSDSCRTSIAFHTKSETSVSLSYSRTLSQTELRVRLEAARESWTLRKRFKTRYVLALIILATLVYLQVCVLSRLEPLNRHLTRFSILRVGADCDPHSAGARLSSV